MFKYITIWNLKEHFYWFLLILKLKQWNSLVSCMYFLLKYTKKSICSFHIIVKLGIQQDCHNPCFLPWTLLVDWGRKDEDSQRWSLHRTPTTSIYHSDLLITTGKEMWKDTDVNEYEHMLSQLDTNVLTCTSATTSCSSASAKAFTSLLLMTLLKTRWRRS